MIWFNLPDYTRLVPKAPDLSWAWPITFICQRCGASCDTHPKDGDVKQAPLVSGAVGEAETPKGGAS